MEPLTKEEAFYFITSILKIPLPQDHEQVDRLAFLNKIVQVFHSVIPFQNINLLSLDEGHRRIPTWKEVKAAVMQGYGGLCYMGSVFLKQLLEALGYDAYLVSCSIFYPDNHIATIVQHLTKHGSKHIVDFNGYPNFEVIPLDFEGESPIYNHSYLEYKFVHGDNSDMVLRLHRKGENRPTIPGKELIIDGWRCVCEIDLTPRELSYFNQPLHDVYTVPGKNSPFLISFRAVLFKDQRLVAVKDTCLLLEKDDHSIEERCLMSREEMMGTVRRYFPQFPTENVMYAIDTLKLF